MTDDTPYTDLIILLDAYQSTHTSASINLKQAVWNLHMARHVKGNVPTTGGEQQVYTALNIREELRAQVVVVLEPSKEEEMVVEVPPELTVDTKEEREVDDEIETIKNDSIDWSRIKSSNFILLRRQQQQQGQTVFTETETVSTSSKVTSSSDNPLICDTGLRQRKKKMASVHEKEQNDVWTEEYEELLENNMDEYEKRLENTNPLHLFGALPPRALKDAQGMMNESLITYVHVANIAREIFHCLEVISKQKK